MIQKLAWLLLIVLQISCTGTDNLIIPSDNGAELEDLLAEPAIHFSPRHYVCYRTSSPPSIDGKLDDPAWTKAPWTEPFIDIEGPYKATPRFQTRAKLLWDSNYLYVAASLEEPNVWANLTERDSVIFYDNDFELFIDPDGDTHNYYELEINALGTEWDLFLNRPYRDNGQALNNWDIKGLKTGVAVAGSINNPADSDRGWTVEIAIPWPVLQECAPENRTPTDGEQWRINFSRVEWRTETRGGKVKKVLDPNSGKPLPENNWVWSPQGLINMHYPEMWAVVQFSEREAGIGKDPFLYNTWETAKWQLRRVYYREINHKRRLGSFTSDMGRLNLGHVELDGFLWPPDIQCTRNGFEARLSAEDRQTVWIITEDGRIWNETGK